MAIQSPRLTCKRDFIKMRDYMDRRVTPPKRVINYLTYLGSPSSMALGFDEISPRSLSSRSDLSGRNIFHLARTDLRDITNLAEFLARSRLSLRNLFHIGEISFVSQKYLSSPGDLFSISPEIAFISCRSQRHYKISPRSG